MATVDDGLPRRFYLDGIMFRDAGTMQETPKRGPYYSLNDAREPDWPAGLQSRARSDGVQDIYLQLPSAARPLRAQSTPVATSAPWSRTSIGLLSPAGGRVIRGRTSGRSTRRFPLAFVAKACAGYASDGVQDILDVNVESIHARTSYFCGSVDDVKDLEACGDVQQGAATVYDA